MYRPPAFCDMNIIVAAINEILFVVAGAYAKFGNIYSVN